MTQEFNKTWQIPKTFKGDLKRPQAKKKHKKGKTEKKPKPKVKTEKKEKEVKEMGEEIKAKKPKKAPKSTKSSDKGDKKKKKGKKEKPEKKEGKYSSEETVEQNLKPVIEKAESVLKSQIDTVKLHKEKLEREAAEKKLEENKKYIFPLTKAVDDNFFTKIFQNWTRAANKIPPQKKTAVMPSSTEAESAPDPNEKKTHKQTTEKKVKGAKKGKK